MTLLLLFLPLMLDPTSQRIYYLHRNQQRTLQVARLRSQMVCNLCIVSIVWGDGFHTRSGNRTTLEYNIDASIHITRFGPYKLREFSGRNNKTGGGREMGVKYGRLPGKTGVLMVWCVCKKIHWFRVLIKAFLVKKKGTKTAGWPKKQLLSRVAKLRSVVAVATPGHPLAPPLVN